MPIVELDNVSKRYGNLTVLNPMSVALLAHQTYVLLGPSGCGKSTLLKLVLGLVSTDTGCVRFHDKEIHRENVLNVRRRIGYVVQSGGLFPHLTAAQNVTLVARHLVWDADRIERRLGELAELTQLPQDCLHRYPAQLSGGQQQRVGLMRALMLDPDVLLLDEPLAALDPLIRRDLQTDLRAVFRSLNKTVVLVTHDVYEAAYFADTILLLRSGEILQRGTFRQLLESPADPFVTRFINAQRTVLEGDQG